MEQDRQGLWLEAPKSAVGQLAVGGGDCGDRAGVLGDARVECWASASGVTLPRVEDDYPPLAILSSIILFLLSHLTFSFLFFCASCPNMTQSACGQDIFGASAGTKQLAFYWVDKRQSPIYVRRISVIGAKPTQWLPDKTLHRVTRSSQP